MSTNRIEQLKIAIEIERANEAGTPIEWEWRTLDGIWLDGSQLRTAIHHIANDHEIRIKPEPKPKPRIVDLEPCDIEPGSVVRLPGWAEGLWWAVVSVNRVNTGVRGRASSPISYAELRSDGWLIHRPSKPGVWERCEKEVAE